MGRMEILSQQESDIQTRDTAAQIGLFLLAVLQVQLLPDLLYEIEMHPILHPPRAIAELSRNSDLLSSRKVA